MRKFFVFVLLFVSLSSTAQSTSPSANTFTEMMGEYRGSLGSGNFLYNVSLFDLETMNPDFNFKGNLYYNAQAASSIYTGEGIMDKGWGADFLPSIYRRIDQENTLYDELYYKVSTEEITGEFQPYSRESRAFNDQFEFSVNGLQGSFRLVYNTNNTASVQLVSSNAFVEIVPNCPITNNGLNGKIINLKGFTITDGNGYSYRFEEAENSGLHQNQKFNRGYSLLIDPTWYNGNFVGYLPYNRAFMLTDITDKYKRTLVQFTYKAYANSLGEGTLMFNYNQKIIDQINIINKYNIVFTNNRSKITKATINNSINEQVENITFSKVGINFNSKDNVKIKGYGFSYFPIPADSPVNNHGNYLKTDYCSDASPSLSYDNKKQNYTAGLLKTISLPFKGKVEIEYETNTHDSNDVGELNELNYDYIEVPVTYDSGNNTYSFFYNTIGITNANDSYYVKFTSTLYTDPFLIDENGYQISIYPGLLTYSNDIPKIWLQGFEFKNQCTDYGEKIIHNANYNNRTVVLERHGGKPANITNVKVYKKTLKPESQQFLYLYGPSVRVKKITETDNNNIINERKYFYVDPTDTRKSSGVISKFLWYLGTPTHLFYKYITIEESGKGKTTYQMNWNGVYHSDGNPNDIIYNPKNIWKYKDNGELVEHVSNNFETYLLSSDLKANLQIEKINTTIKTYEGPDFKTTSTEKLFDTTSMLPVYNKITEEAVNETFQENYTHEKLGNAYYQTQVEKFKNNIPLNRSVFEYGQYVNTQAYNMLRAKVAKNTLPLEIEKEITGYDFGNITEYKTKDGTVVSQIWGYDNSKLVAELKNVSYANISSATIATIKSTSSSISYNEANLITALNSLRAAHPNGFITTYAYNRSIQLTSITDANGRKETYQYDAFNRLYRVLNNEGLIIKEYNYNIKN